MTQREITARIRSSCTCCEQPIHLTVTSDLEIDEAGAEDLLLFVPSVDWNRLSAPTIVPDY